MEFGMNLHLEITLPFLVKTSRTSLTNKSNENTIMLILARTHYYDLALLRYYVYFLTWVNYSILLGAAHCSYKSKYSLDSIVQHRQRLRPFLLTKSKPVQKN
jgi:hypothetical protein